jgi:hypothetical protein
MKLPELKVQIEQALIPLINTRLTDIGRAHNLEWMIFNPIGLAVQEPQTDPPSIEYALNVQCVWRIIGPEGIVVASEDLYYAAGDNPFRNIDDFNWTHPGSNRCDERTSMFKETLANKALIVVSVEADAIGGLSIYLSEGYSIDLLPADSLDREYWRFFRRNEITSHFVVTGEGIKD